MNLYLLIFSLKQYNNTGISLFTAICYLIVREDNELNFKLHQRGEIPPSRIESGTTKFRPHFYENFSKWFMITFTFYNSVPEHRELYYKHALIPVVGKVTDTNERRRPKAVPASAARCRVWVRQHA